MGVDSDEKILTLNLTVGKEAFFPHEAETGKI